MSNAAHHAATHRRAREEDLTPAMIEEFRARLLAMKADLVHRIHAEPPVAPRAAREGDLADQANADLDFEQEADERRREHRELAEIEHALARIENGTYGICAVTGEPIGLRRLQANPTATLSLAAQEQRENRAGR
jgi:RNA polymerase-binding transcription factor